MDNLPADVLKSFWLTEKQHCSPCIQPALSLIQLIPLPEGEPQRSKPKQAAHSKWQQSWRQQCVLSIPTSWTSLVYYIAFGSQGDSWYMPDVLSSQMESNGTYYLQWHKDAAIQGILSSLNRDGRIWTQWQSVAGTICLDCTMVCLPASKHPL